MEARAGLASSNGEVFQGPPLTRCQQENRERWGLLLFLSSPFVGQTLRGFHLPYRGLIFGHGHWNFWVRSALLIAVFPANIHAVQKRLAIAGRPEALLPRTILQIVIVAATRDGKAASQNPTQFY